MINLKRLREEKKINQLKLANDIGVSRSTIAMWETGGSQPDNDNLMRLAKYFNVSVDYLLGLTEDEPKVDLNQMTAKEILAYAEKQNETTYDILGYDGENATRTTLTKDEYEKVLGIIEVLRKENN